MFFFLAQTEQGDIFKITLETDEDMVCVVRYTTEAVNSLLTLELIDHAHCKSYPTSIYTTWIYCCCFSMTVVVYFIGVDVRWELHSKHNSTSFQGGGHFWRLKGAVYKPYFSVLEMSFSHFLMGQASVKNGAVFKSGFPRLLENPGKSWIFSLNFPWPGKSWKITLVLESPGNWSLRSWKVLEKYPWKLRVTEISLTSSTKFGELILSKIIKIVATRCHIWRLKCTKFNSGWGSVLTAFPQIP